jgi:hypothetical protein
VSAAPDLAAAVVSSCAERAGLVSRSRNDERERTGLVSRPAVDAAMGNSRGRGEGVAALPSDVRGAPERRLVRPVRLAEDAGGREEKGDKRLGPVEDDDVCSTTGSGVASRAAGRGKVVRTGGETVVRVASGGGRTVASAGGRATAVVCRGAPAGRRKYRARLDVNKSA